MDTAGYVVVSRQSGLWKEMQVVANNIANLSTKGFRGEGVIFAEMVEAVDAAGRSVAFTAARGRLTDFSQGGLTQTDAPFDLAIEGPGFFQVETPAGLRLTRAGNFMPGPDGELVNSRGHRLLDAGGAPVFVPPDAAEITIASDGTLSADGQPIGAIGRVEPADPMDLIREDGVLFRTEGDVLPVDEGTIVQGFLESANIDPVGEMARMIAVQRAYEMSQGLAEREDQRIRAAIRTLGQTRA